MKSVEKLILIIFLTLPLGSAASENVISFSPNPRTIASLRVNGNEVHYTVSFSGKTRQGEIRSDTDKEIHMEIADYRFDGSLGFSVWHVDDGMGTHKMYRVFVFQSNIGDFVERYPRCGDAFIDLRLDNKNNRLLSTYFRNNSPRLCATKIKGG
ncbi:MULTISPECIES: hypothetical protein [Cupriavidus]